MAFVVVMFHLLFLLISCPYMLVHASVDYDIVIGGGSLAGLSAAITLGNLTSSSNNEQHRKLKIAYLDITDWPGGQLTASLVPPDFGAANENSINLPASFVELLLTVGSINKTWDTNPGECWVSTKCFSAVPVVDYIMRLLNSYSSNIDVYLNTVVKSVEATEGSTKITGIKAIQRIARIVEDKHEDSFAGYHHPLSDSIFDWYDPSPSMEFEKHMVDFTAKIFVEATEFGDILTNAAAAMGLMDQLVVSGFETPNELSETHVSNCGQSSTFPFVAGYSEDNTKSYRGLSNAPRNEYNEDRPFSFGDYNWSDIWSYRRIKTSYETMGSRAVDPESPVGEMSNQNWNGGNDYLQGYMFLSMEESLKQSKSDTGWFGGINVDTLRGMESRSYGWFDYFVSQAESDVQKYISLNLSETMTKHGLSKMPYIRDSRRSRHGVGDFRLSYVHGLGVVGEDGTASVDYEDKVAIGSYNFLDMHLLNVSNACPNIDAYPDYLTKSFDPLLPYYIPFRALTARYVDNLIIPGKGMAQTFLANAGTRLHPTEWSTGVAAGAAAFIMATENKSTSDIYKYDIKRLQTILEQQLGSPLTWTL